MTVAALALFAVYLVVGFGVRTVVQVRRTGDSGWRGISGRPGTREWWAGAAFAAALVAGVLGPVTATFGLDPIDSLTTPLVQIVASGTAAVGITGTFLTQVAMGSSWRIGVDETETETTDLVTDGPFAVVRNPIFSAMAVTGAGLAFMVPNMVALLGLALLLVALQLQVRGVEEPYLRRMHGASYVEYQAAVGRFLPWLGRQRRSLKTGA